MADSKISALTAVTTPAETDEVAINQAGTSFRAAMSSYQPLYNTSTATQSFGATATEANVTGSNITIPQTRLQAGSLYRCTMIVTKTAAGTATPTATLRYGTAGTQADASRGLWNSTAQTGVSDNMRLQIEGLFYSVGASTSAVIRASWNMYHNLSATGFSTLPSQINSIASSGFDSTVVGSIIGVSLAAGTTGTPAWTVTSVFAELLNV